MDEHIAVAIVSARVALPRNRAARKGTDVTSYVATAAIRQTQVTEHMCEHGHRSANDRCYGRVLCEGATPQHTRLGF